MIGSICTCYHTFIFFFLFLFPSVWLRIHARYAWTITHIDSYTRTDRLYAHRPSVYSINTCNIGCALLSLLLLVFLPQYYCFTLNSIYTKLVLVFLPFEPWYNLSSWRLRRVSRDIPNYNERTLVLSTHARVLVSVRHNRLVVTNNYHTLQTVAIGQTVTSPWFDNE